MRARRPFGVMLLVVVAAAVGAVWAGSASGRPQELTPADRHELLQRFMPILYFHPDEVWAPVAVDRFLQLVRHERQTARGVWTSLRVFLCIGGWLGVVGDAVSEVDA